MQKNLILYDKVKDKERIVVSKDTYNWIVMVGSKDIKWKDYQKRARHWYFTSLESLFSMLFTILFREDLKSFKTIDILNSLNDVESQIMEMGRMIDKRMEKLYENK